MTDSIDPNASPEPLDVEVSQAGERDAVLAAVLREQTRKADVEAQARKRRVRRQGIGLRHLALGIATAMSLWIWRWPPGVLVIAPPGPPPVEEEEATLRLVMYFQAQKIEQYLLDTGRVPLALDDAAPAFRGMEYVRLTNRDCRILGRTGRVTLSYSSVEPLDTFVVSTAIESCTGLAIENCTLGGGDEPLVLCSQSLFGFADLGDDGLCRGGPDKGCGVIVSAIDVVVDRLD